MPRPVPDTEEFRKECLCLACPTYPQLLGDKAFYCSLGVTSHKLSRQGCLCPECYVWHVNNLGDGQPAVYFCLQPVA